MEPVRYYREEFGAKLQKVCRASNSRHISIVSLFPDPSPGGRGGQLANCAAAFSEVRSKALFLFCYFFTALIDQAIHASLRQDHVHFDRLAGYPKLVGILATACTNLHPAVLLLAATLYLNDSEVDEATVHYECLADFFIEDYHVFLDVKYPALTRRLVDPGQRHEALCRLFKELSSALALLFVQGSFGPYSCERPNLQIYESWVLLVLIT